MYSDIPGDTLPNQKVGFGRFRESVSLQPLMISDIMAATSSSRSTASRRTASAAPCVANVGEASHHALVKAALPADTQRERGSSVGNRRGIVQTRTGTASVSHFQDPSLTIRRPSADPRSVGSQEGTIQSKSKVHPISDLPPSTPLQEVIGVCCSICSVVCVCVCVCVCVHWPRQEKQGGRWQSPFCPVLIDLPPNTPICKKMIGMPKCFVV